MAKLTKLQKEHFAQAYSMLVKQKGNMSFFFEPASGISALAIYTGPMRKHFKVVVSYCGGTDTFKKKLALIECFNKIEDGGGITMCTLGDTTIENCLLNFMDNNFAYEDFCYNRQTL